MTKKEAKKYYLLKNKWDTINREELYDLIDEIYDDFENRTCKNCKYFKGSNKIANCSNLEVGAMNGGAFIDVDKDFGCNKFEKKI